MTDHEPEALEAEVVREDDERDAPASNTIVAAADILPGTLYLLPLSERPFFPAQALPLLLNEEPWLSTIEAAAIIATAIEPTAVESATVVATTIESTAAIATTVATTITISDCEIH